MGVDVGRRRLKGKKRGGLYTSGTLSHVATLFIFKVGGWSTHCAHAPFRGGGNRSAARLTAAKFVGTSS